MASAANSIALPATSDRVDGRAATSDAQATERTLLEALMKRARTWFAHKPSVELAEILGCPVRTAERYFAGDRTPDAAALMRLLRSAYGVRLVQEATSNLPAKEFAAFWHEMALAVLRAEHREQLDGD